MSTGLIGQRELSEVTTDHVELDFDVVETLSVVHGDVASDHLGHHNGISQVSLDWHRLLTGHAVFLGFLAFRVKSDILMLDLYMTYVLLLEKRLRILALKSSTNCS